MAQAQQQHQRSLKMFMVFTCGHCHGENYCDQAVEPQRRYWLSCGHCGQLTPVQGRPDRWIFLVDHAAAPPAVAPRAATPAPMDPHASARTSAGGSSPLPAEARASGAKPAVEQAAETLDLRRRLNSAPEPTQVMTGQTPFPSSPGHKLDTQKCVGKVRPLKKTRRLHRRPSWQEAYTEVDPLAAVG